MFLALETPGKRVEVGMGENKRITHLLINRDMAVETPNNISGAINDDLENTMTVEWGVSEFPRITLNGIVFHVQEGE